MREDIQAIIFDVDGTLIEEQSWIKLNLDMGVTPEMDKQLYDEYYAGKFTYQEWVDQIVEIYKKRGNILRSHINHVLLGYTLKSGATRTVEKLGYKGYHIGIISGGLDVVIHSVAKKLGIAKCFATSNSTVKYDKCGRLKNIISRGHDHEIKLQDLDKLCRLWDIRPTQCAYVGDGPPDKALFEITGHGITFSDERCSKLHDSCWRQIDQLPDLLDFL